MKFTFFSNKLQMMNSLLTVMVILIQFAMNEKKGLWILRGQFLMIVVCKKYFSPMYVTHNKINYDHLKCSLKNINLPIFVSTFNAIIGAFTVNVFRWPFLKIILLRKNVHVTIIHYLLSLLLNYHFKEFLTVACALRKIKLRGSVWKKSFNKHIFFYFFSQVSWL